MKKLLTFSLAFMLAVLFNTNAIAQIWWNNTQNTPAEGEVTVEQFSQIRLTFPGVNNLTAGWKAMGEFYPEGAPYQQIIGTIEGNTVVFNYDRVINPGTMRLEIGKSTLTGDGVVQGEKIIFNWTVVAGAFAFESAVPANGAKVNSLEEIVVDFAAQSALTGSATVNGAGQQATFAPTGTPGQVKATLPQAINAEGVYSIAIPEGAFTAADGTSNEAVT